MFCFFSSFRVPLHLGWAPHRECQLLLCVSWVESSTLQIFCCCYEHYIRMVTLTRYIVASPRLTPPRPIAPNARLLRAKPALIWLDSFDWMNHSLEEYLSLYDTPSAYDPPRKAGNLRVHSSASSGHDEDGSVDNSDDVFSSRGTGAILPPSMLLHAPALLRITQSARGSASPLCHLRVEKTAR